VATCEKCGNAYDKCFELVIQGRRHVFDSFECAIQAMAPTCGHCLCRIIGHGVEVGYVLLRALRRFGRSHERSARPCRVALEGP
jgi:hypothetical protein